MNTQTTSSIEARVSELELQLATSTANAETEPIAPLATQLAGLAKEFEKLHASHPELAPFYANLSELKLWSDTMEDSFSTVPLQDVQQILLANYERLRDQLEALVELQTFAQTHNMNNLMLVSPEILAYTARLRHLEQEPSDLRAQELRCNETSVQSMVLCERYLELQLEKNRFMVDVEARLKALTRRLGLVERARKGDDEVY
ncbi:hypothetical protein BABINDRAFT_117111 [Babjeviella inositovora NRRL Y-12698]|uniref:Uncharacterized protein n=1 Tax=Babjeviella inositovora NRRL Y-12698 TaxID=984486 RepID=A0A1E3QGV4_9ASCO|nr:uncharacterized protein BABINDRAFT_117111 [Babjeviella inositovora NRRL Y-12698]ODQ76921.1 hypothetical protein BABINDRAFT_117111 [Babjeviella inositovora NRRL Y-12698]